MQRVVVFGQMLDTAPPELEPKGAAGETASVERTYLLKTGSYTVRGPLELGAILAGASSDALARIARFAEPLGVAFQLRDDLLSTFGTERTTGKPAHGDLRTGKRTWLMAAAMKDARVRDAMPGAFGVAAATEERLLRLAEAIEASGAKTAVEARLATLAAEARAALPALGLSSDMERVLSGAVVALTERAS
jgi:geranylgeranyl diphosphate synthase type I